MDPHAIGVQLIVSIGGFLPIDNINWTIGRAQVHHAAMNPREAINVLIAQGWSIDRIAGELNLATRQVIAIHQGRDGRRWEIGEMLIQLATEQRKDAA